MARGTTSAPPTVERKIQFYRADVGVDGSGRPLPFDPAPAFVAIDRLPFSDGPRGRYLVDDDGNAVCGWPGGTTIRFCQIRRTGLPQLERAGRVSDLNIAADAGLLEPVHVVFFPSNIVGADFNFYGPRLSRLGYYLWNKSVNTFPLATFHPLLRHDVAEQLDHLTELRLFDFRVKASYVEIIRRADRSLADAFAANARILDGRAEDLEVVLRPAKDARYEALRRLTGTIKSLLRGRDLRENAERFQVRGKSEETGKVELIDLLRDHLIAHKRVLRLDQRSRAIDPNSAFEAIRTAHAELADDLRRAASIVS